MRFYPTDTAEAMARVVAMMIVADAHIDDREIAMLEKINAFESLSMSRREFMAVARDYCGDLARAADVDGSTQLLDPARTDLVIDAVAQREKRKLVARLLLAVVSADHVHGEGELVLFAHILDRWQLTRDEIAD